MPMPGNLLMCRNELDGLTATRMIRAMEKPALRQVPMITVTACAMIGDREKCLEAGMNDYFTKPFALGELLAVVRKWL